jgi:hypothetical protein
MAKAYCSDCGMLVDAYAGERHDGYFALTKSRRWYPVPGHLDGDGKPCGSTKEAGDVTFSTGPIN